jgi:hypothetical protein
MDLYLQLAQDIRLKQVYAAIAISALNRDEKLARLQMLEQDLFRAAVIGDRISGNRSTDLSIGNALMINLLEGGTIFSS